MVKHVPNMPHIFYKVDTIKHNDCMQLTAKLVTSFAGFSVADASR
jgi:hypothetical protein